MFTFCDDDHYLLLCPHRCVRVAPLGFDRTTPPNSCFVTPEPLIGGCIPFGQNNCLINTVQRKLRSGERRADDRPTVEQNQTDLR